METEDVSITSERTAIPGRPDRRGLSRAGMIVAAVVVAGAVAAVGFVVGRATSSGVGRAGAAVVSIATQFLRGGTTIGSGMIITASGEVLTNYHLVKGAARIRVYLAAGGVNYAAAVDGIDPSDDIALLQVENVINLPSVSLGDSSALVVGDHVTAIGGAGVGGGSPVETQGSVAGLGQSATLPDAGGLRLDGMIRLSAQISATDCGGPLVNSDGHVVGMDAAGAGRPGQPAASANNAYAIPIDGVMAIVHDMETSTPNPKVFRGGGAFLGVDVKDSVSPAGAAVLGVEPSTPAQAAGIVPSDVIVSVAGTPIDSVLTLRAVMQQHRGGDRVEVGWIDASGRRHDASLTLVTGTAT